MSEIKVTLCLWCLFYDDDDDI